MTDNKHADGINATWLRVHATVATIKVLGCLRPRYSAVLFLTPGICVKYGPFQHLSEAASIQFVSSETSVPVPKRSPDSKARLLQQLKGYVDEIRSLRPPIEGAVQAVDGGKLYDVRLPDGVTGYGPFRSVDEFHSFLRDGIKQSPQLHPEVGELVEKHKSARYDTLFTHGDLNSMNVIVNGDSITGIVDWDTAGWYPEYWEYTTAVNINPFNELWKHEVPRFLEEYPEAAYMERLRQKHFGAF